MNQRHLRINLKNRVGLFWRGFNTPANIEDISITGALVRADLPVKIGDFMSVHLKDKSCPDAMEMGGEVIRMGQQRRDMPTFALQFLKIPEALRVFLLRTLAKHNSTLES